MVNVKVVAGLVAGALLIGVLAGRSLADDGNKNGPAKNSPGPTKSVAGVPTGWAKSKEGAAGAAIAYQAALAEAFTVGSAQREAVVEAVVAEGSTARELSDTEDAVAAMTEAFGELQDFAIRSAPMGYRIVGYSGDRAHVETWYVAVSGKSDAAVIASRWAIVTVDLVWERGDWKLERQGDDGKEGPSPGDVIPPAEFVRIAKDFKEFTHVALDR